MRQDYSVLEQTIGYEFKDKQLIVNALTHKSFANEHKYDNVKDNERLEFFGDAILEMVVSEYLFTNPDQMPEGEMTNLRKGLVDNEVLAKKAIEIGIDKCLYLGKGQETSGVTVNNKLVASSVEALIAAIYLDGGMEVAKKFIKEFVIEDVSNIVYGDYKTILQEQAVAAKLGNVSYDIVGESGPDHHKVFDAVVMIDGKIIGKGTGKKKKEAENKAAYNGLAYIKKNYNKG